MEETFYKRVSVKEELPPKKDRYITDLGTLTYEAHTGKWCYYDIKGRPSVTNPDWWLKPLPNLSRDKIIAQINEIAADHIVIGFDDIPFIGGVCGEKILDAILKSGLPDKKVEIKYPKESNYQMGSENQDHYKAWSDGYNKAIQDTKDLNIS